MMKSVVGLAHRVGVLECMGSSPSNGWDSIPLPIKLGRGLLIFLSFGVD